MKRRKYGNRRVEVAAGQWADSEKEAKRWFDLKVLEQAGTIANLAWHPSWPLVVNGVRITRFTADSAYDVVATGERVVEDVKSEATRADRAYNLRRKLMLAVHGIAVREYL